MPAPHMPIGPHAEQFIWWQPVPGQPGQWIPAPWGLPMYAPHSHGGEHHHDGDDHDHDHHHGDDGHHQGHHDSQHLFQQFITPSVPREQDEWLALGYIDDGEERPPGHGSGHGGSGHGSGPGFGPGHGPGFGPGHGPGFGPGHGHFGPGFGPGFGPFGPWGGGIFPIPIPIPIGGGGGGGGVAPIPSQAVFVTINGGSAYPNATGTYQVMYQPGLTIFDALSSTGVIQLSPSGQILLVSGVAIGGNVNYVIRLNGRNISTNMLNYNLQPNDQISVDLIYA